MWSTPLVVKQVHGLLRNSPPPRAPLFVKQVPFFLPSTLVRYAATLETKPLPPFWAEQARIGRLQAGAIPLCVYSDTISGESKNPSAGFYLITCYDLRYLEATRMPVVAIRKSSFAPGMQPAQK